MGDNVEMGIYPTSKALAKAQELESDLVEISPKASPMVSGRKTKKEKGIKMAGSLT